MSHIIEDLDPDAAGWHRFKPVTQNVPSRHKLYRASAPNYKSKDSDQDLTDRAVKFLRDKGIKSIISFNEIEYSQKMKDRLKVKPEIKYKHIKLGDFKPPTIGQLKEANDFFLQNESTLVHCGYGHGRTGTGITGLQIYTQNGRNLQPLASVWTKDLDDGGNNVEKRKQVSILAEQRNRFFPREIPPRDAKTAFAIINYETGFYLTLENGKVSSQSPESVETATTIGQAYQWVFSKDSQGNYTLSNKTNAANFALTKSSGASIGDQLTYGSKTQGNALFTVHEVASGGINRLYVISPKPNPNLAVVIKEPTEDPSWTLAKGKEPAKPVPVVKPAVLAANKDNTGFRLWVLIKGDFRAAKAEAEEEGEGEGEQQEEQQEESVGDV